MSAARMRNRSGRRKKKEEKRARAGQTQTQSEGEVEGRKEDGLPLHLLSLALFFFPSKEEKRTLAPSLAAKEDGVAAPPFCTGRQKKKVGKAKKKKVQTIDKEGGWVSG